MLQFLIVDRPKWYPPGDYQCRGCGYPTSKVLSVESRRHHFPCCDSPECREVVRQLMAESIMEVVKRTPYVRKRRSRFQIWIRWVAIRLAARERMKRELMLRRPDLWVLTQSNDNNF